MAEVQILSALARIPIGLVRPGVNARGDVGDVGELAQSIRALGMQKPLLVCDTGHGTYEVLDGHRRLAAAQLLRLTHVDALLRRDLGAAVRLQRQLAMHAQAKSFDPIAEATALSALMFDHGMSREDIARSVGKSPSWVRDRIALLQLEPEERQAVACGSMSVSTAASLVGYRRAQREGRIPRPPVHQDGGRRGESREHCPTCQCGTGVPGA